MNSVAMVVGLNNESVHNFVESFLNTVKRESINTEKNYRGHIKQFFSYAFGKETNQITWEELKSIKNKLVENYIDFLLEKHTASSINSKISCLKAMMDFIIVDVPDIKRNVFKRKKMLSQEPNSYDSLTDIECHNLFEFAKEQKYKGLAQSLFFKTSYYTAIRKSAVLSITWSNIKQKVDKDTGALIWIIQVKDKRNKYDEVAISDVFYEELCQLKNLLTQSTDKLFDFDHRVLYNTLDAFCEKYKIDRTARNIGIHSLKRSSGNMAYKLSGGNIKLLQEHLHHSSPAMSLHYLDGNNSYTKQLSYQIDNKFDINSLKEYSKEQLLQAIDKCGVGTIVEILGNL